MPIHRRFLLFYCVGHTFARKVGLILIAVNKLFAALFAVTLLARTAAASEPVGSEALAEVTLRVGIYQITAEVAATEKTRERGLMYRAHLPPHRGMLFYFPVAERHCMWMKNTPIPLAVAFVDEEGRIVNIEEMEPLTLTSHCAAKPVRWALEMTGGWFRDHGVGVGMRLEGLPPPHPLGR